MSLHYAQFQLRHATSEKHAFYHPGADSAEVPSHLGSSLLTSLVSIGGPLCVMLIDSF